MADDFRAPDAIVLDALKSLLGPNGWKHGPEAARYFDDPRGRFEGQACLIVLPETTRQVSDIVKLCNAAGVGLIPYSGGTGVVAGQLSTDSANAIILSLERMNKVRDLLLDDSAIVVEAGCILEHVHAVAAEHDMIFPLSMASKGSCCIGGNLATNAGGIQVVRHGNARDLCLGIEAVLPDGAIISDLSPLRKNNTGYDLRHLLIGSEGTLGIITAATLILKPLDPETTTAFCAINSPAAALALFKTLRKALGESLSALELMSGFGLDLVTSQFSHLSDPFDAKHDWYLLIEAGGPEGIHGRLEATLETCLEKELIFDAVIAQSQAQRQRLWELRENTPEANRAGGAFCNSDTSVPISKVDAFIHETIERVLAIHPALRINSYGHIGDGNVHHNVLPPEGVPKQDFLRDHPGIIDTVRNAITEATLNHAGSISAEHGIGRLKSHDLQAFGDSNRLLALKRIKRALDPQNIMNPGALLNGMSSETG